MDLDYKSSQSSIELIRSEFARISVEEINENTYKLIDYIDKIDFSDESINTKILEYEEEIANFLENGAKCTALTHNDLLIILTNYNTFLLKRIKEEKMHMENIFDPFLHILFALSKSNDENTSICAHNSKYHEFLISILLYSNEYHVVSHTIKVIFNLIFERPKTSELFNDPLIIKHLYDNYNKYFFLNCTDAFIGEQDSNKIIQEIIIPSFELALILLIYRENQSAVLEEYIFRLVVTFGNILQKNRSNDNQQVYFLQIKMILSQLYYILTHADDKKCQNINIIDLFSTFVILQEIINCIEIGFDITILSLKCLIEYAKTFSGAYLILIKYDFCSFRPNQTKFSDEKQFIEAIKYYCQIWSNAIKSILSSKVSHKGRVQSALISVQKNTQFLLEYIKDISDIHSNFEYQKILSITIITLANYNDDNILNQIISQFPDIIEKSFCFLEERNPNDIFQIINCLINVLNHYIKNGSEIEQIKNDLSIYKQKIIDELDYIRNIFEGPENNIMRTLCENINQIEEMLEQILPSD